MIPLHDLDHLHRRLGRRPGRPLPGVDAPDPTRSRAAVAAVLRDTVGGVEVLLIRRSEREGDPWSGHMALPGGRHEPSDTDLLHTALRETEEELGLSLEPDALLSTLDDLEAVARGRRTGLVIRPFVFRWPASAPRLRPNEEVAEAVWAPLVPIHRGDWDTERPYELAGKTWPLPAWNVHGRIVWGLTHRILSDLLGRL